MKNYEQELQEFIDYNEIDVKDKTIKELCSGVFELAQKDKNNAPSDDQMVMYINQVVTGKRDKNSKAKNKAQRIVVYRGVEKVSPDVEEKVNELEQEIKVLQERIIKLTTPKPDKTKKVKPELVDNQITLDLGF